MTKAQTHQIHVEKNDGWETPEEIFDDTCKKYKVNPTLDVCASQTNHKCSKYFTISDDGLSKQWNEPFFMNPPYSEINAWMSKAYESHRKYNIDALILVFSKTSTKWWHDYVEDKGEPHFHKGRIKFLLDGVEPRRCQNKKCDNSTRYTVQDITCCPDCNSKLQKSSPTYDSVWIVYRKTDKICKSCDVNPLFPNQITCEQCHKNCKPEVLE